VRGERRSDDAGVRRGDAMTRDFAMNHADFSALDAAGLNLHAVFELAELPDALRASLDPEHAYAQLLLIGNGGPALWAAVEAEGRTSADPIDEYSVRHVERWLTAQAAEARLSRWRVVYPGAQSLAIDLQAFGRRAGWHHASPFMVGINARWGPWFAYRVAVLADTRCAPTPAWTEATPCMACSERPCSVACPGKAAGADGGQGFALERCIDYRRQPDSACRATCVARLACPVAADARYSAAQLRHSYSISLAMIERYCR
jgi:hypothetical protein